jgi:CheY-like chemotaxis protein
MDILVVDDDADTREMLGLVLREAGHHVSEATDGMHALELWRAGSRPSLILLDMMMPRMDGEAFLRTLGRELRRAGTEVYVISGHRSVREKAEELGASGYFVKPVDLDRLFKVMEGLPPRAHASVHA